MTLSGTGDSRIRSRGKNGEYENRSSEDEEEDNLIAEVSFNEATPVSQVHHRVVQFKN